MNQKPVLTWEPKKVETKPGEYVGKFRTRVPEGTPNAVFHEGETADGREWKYWGVDVDSINGVIRWIDARTSDYGPKIVLFLETDKRLHQLTVDYNCDNLHKIGNHLLGLGKELATAHINISYWVRKKLDSKKTPKVNKNGEIIWARDLYFRDVPEKFTFDEWKVYAAENNLEWFQETRKGKTEWNNEAEMAFWLSKIVGVQRYLLTTDACLPFCYNSMTACEKPSPGGNLTADEIATAKSIYEAVKPLYKFPFGRTEVNADDIDTAPTAGYQPAPAPQPATTQRTATATAPAGEDFFPPDTNSYEVVAPGDADDLPF